jgi:SAM-dependent methyltransferase
MTDWTEHWDGFVVSGYKYAAFPPGHRVLDLGFGRGVELRQLGLKGCHPVGVESNRERAKEAAATGMRVVVAAAEQLPFQTRAFDGVLSKVMLPYTDEERVLAEIGRVLRLGGECELVTVGLGYYLAYLFVARRPGRKRYAIRTIVNTWCYRATGKWPLTRTVYQSMPWLRRSFTRHGLQVIRRTHTRRYLGMPVFIYLRLRKL